MLSPRLLALVCSALCFVGGARAQVVWSGIVDANFSNPANWVGTLLNDGTLNATFPSTLTVAPVVNLNFSLNSLTYASGVTSFTLANSGGAGLTIQSSLSLAGGAQTISAPLTLGSGFTFSGPGGQAFLTVSGGLTAASGFTANNGIYLTVSGPWTVGGTTTLQSGAVLEFTGGSRTLTHGIVNNGLALSFNASGASATTVNGAISGSGIVNYFSPVTLNAANTYTGQSTIGSTVTVGVADALPTGGAVFFSGGNARLLVNENQTLGTIYSVGGFGNVSLATGRTLTLSAGQNNNYTGTIDGAGALTLSGGAHTFTGSLTHTGGTTVTAGQMYLGNGGTTGSLVGNVTVASGANFGVNRSDAFTFNGIVSGGGSLVKDGTGTLTIANVQSYGGATALFNGTLRLGANAVLPATTTVSFVTGPAVVFDLNNFHQVVASISSSSGATNGSILLGSGNLTIGRNGSPDGFDGTISGSGGLIKQGTNTQSLAGANTFTGGTAINEGTIVVTNSTGSGLGTGTVAIATAGTLQMGQGGPNGFVSGNITNQGSVVVNRSDNITYASAMSGAGTLAKLGAGTLTLTGANTFTGGTTINLGAVTIGNGGTTGSLAGNVTLTSNSAQLQFNRSDAVTFSGSIAGSGSVKLLGGTLTLGGANTYSGNTFVTAGTLIASGAGTLSPNSTLRVNTGAQLQVNANQTAGGIEDYTTGLSGNVTIAAGSALTLNRTDGAGLIYSGVVSGAGSLVISGSGPQVLAGANTYSGGTLITGGSLRLGANNALPVGGNVTLTTTNVSAGTLDLFNRSQTIGALTFGGNGSALGASVALGSGTLTLGGSVIFDGTGNPHGAFISGGTLVLGGNRTFNIGDSFGTSSELTISSAISGAGATLTKTGTGALVLSGTSNHAATIISNGQLRLGANGALPAGGNVTILGSGDVSGSSLELGNFTQAIGALTLGGTTSTASAAIYLDSSGVLTLGGNVTFDATNAPNGANIAGGTLALGGTRTFNIGRTPNSFTDLTITSIISGAGSGLTKTGTGNLMLMGANTYTGTTTINGGRLMIGGSLATTPVVINATSAGNNASLELFNSTAIGALTFGGAGASNAATNSIQISSGTLTLTGGVTFVADANNNPQGAQINGSDVALAGTQVFAIADSSIALADVTIGAAISGGGITKTGAGTLLLTNSSSAFAGPVTIQAGALAVTRLSLIGSDSALGTGLLGNGTIAIGNGAIGATLRYVGSGPSTTDRPIDLAGTTGGATLDVSSSSGSVRFTGPVFSSGAGAKTLTLAGSSFSASEIAGVISDNSPTNRTALLKTGAGTWILSGANTYTGGTTISGGRLELGASNTLPLGGDVTIRATNGEAILSLGNTTQSIGALTFGGTGGGSFASNLVLLGSGTLTLGGNVTYHATSAPSSGVIAGDHPFGGGTPFGGTLSLGNATRTFSIADSGATPFDFIIYSNITGAAGVDLLKAGTGSLTLAGQSTYLGNTTIAAGTLYLASSSFDQGTTSVSSIAAGPVGLGTLVMQSGTTLAAGGVFTGFGSTDDDITIANTVSLANNVTLGTTDSHQRLAFTGTVSAANASTVVHLLGEEAISFEGTISAANAGTAIVFDSGNQSTLARALISSSIGVNVTSLTANRAALVFSTPRSLAHTATINVTNNGYVGVGYGGGTAPSPAALLARIANPATFAGTIGFDTDIRQIGAPYTFTGTAGAPIDFSAFGSGLTIGSISAAVIDGTLIPASNGYQFGNGGGLLFVRSALTDGAGSRSVAVSSNGAPGNALTVAFQGANTFTGNLSVTNSLALLDSFNALPATATLNLGANGYIGYTELFRLGPGTPTTFANFTRRLGTYTASSVIGLDSTVFLASLGQGGGRVVTESIDLTSLNAITLGSATRTLLLGPILAPNQGGANRTLALLGAGRGELLIGSDLTAGNVSRVIVGTADAPLAGGTVELLGANTYTGGTTLLGGQLLLGRSSQAFAGTIVNGPLGTGALTVAGNALHPVLAASDTTEGSDLVLHNAFILGSALQLGLRPGDDGGSSDQGVLALDGYPQLILNGILSDLDATHVGSLNIYTGTVLNGANTYSGGTNVFAGSLTLGHNSALGSGAVTLSQISDFGQAISLNVANGARTIANPITLNLFNDPFLAITGTGSLTLNGGLTLNSGVILAPQAHPLYVNGAVTGTGRLRVDTSSLVFLGGTNTYSGGTQVDQGGLVFGSNTSIPGGTALLTADYAGYIGLGTPPTNLQGEFIDRFNKTATRGTIGFDTPGAGATNIFAGNINLTGFDSSARLGSATSAVLSGTITPGGSGYNFGGGGGLLQITSALTDGGFGRGLSVNSLDFAPLTLRLSGANTFTGGISVNSSGLIFDAAALPTATGIISASPGSYVGTTATGVTPNAFLSLFDADADRFIIGFDSFTGTPYTVASGTTIDLAGRFSPGLDPQLMLGTATQAVIDGAIVLPTAQANYRFAGFKGGQLTVGSLLGGTRGVEIGDTSNAATFGTPTQPTAPRSSVTLTGANTYTGGTRLNAGSLILGHDLALGTGTLTIADNELHGARLGLFASGGARAIANAIALGGDLDIGGTNNLTLSGIISGGGELYKVGTGTLTLTGANTFSGGVYIGQGTVVFGSTTAAGTGPLQLGTAGSPTAVFAVSMTVNGISANHASDAIQLANGVTLTVIQDRDADFLGAITGNGSVVFSGPGGRALSDLPELRIAGANSYTGSTTINSGVGIIAAHNQAFGAGVAPGAGAQGSFPSNTVTLDGGRLIVNTGITLANDFTLTSGTLGGGGALQPGGKGVDLGAGVTIAPGMSSIGTFTFDGARLSSGAVLTLTSGGVYHWQLMDALATTGGWDLINVSGTAAITSTAAQPFTLSIQPLTSLDLLSVSALANFNPAQPYSWAVLNATAITGFTSGSLVVDWSAISSQVGGGTFSLSLNNTNTSLMLNFTPIPEPSTYAMLAAGAVAIVCVVRRRRR